MKTIYFDMDGTLVDLYGVDNWLKKLRLEDSSPYVYAEPLVNTKELEELFLQLKSIGYKLGIITWGSKYSSEKFVEKVRLSKELWLKNNFPRVEFDEFVTIDYFCNKASAVKDPFGILFDDDTVIRENWPGISYSPEDIFPVLKNLVKAGN